VEADHSAYQQQPQPDYSAYYAQQQQQPDYSAYYAQQQTAHSNYYQQPYQAEEAEEEVQEEEETPSDYGGYDGGEYVNAAGYNYGYDHSSHPAYTEDYGGDGDGYGGDGGGGDDYGDGDGGDYGGDGEGDDRLRRR